MAPQFHPGRKVLFQHVPCTGGAEFFSVLWQLYGPHQTGIYPDDGSDAWPRIAAALEPASPFHFVSAHADPIGPLAPHIEVGSFYRDPVERALSQLYFNRRMAREKGLPERILPPEHEWTPLGLAGSNYYLRGACRLAGIPLTNKDPVDGRILATAKAVVDRGYLWLGITELFQPSLQLLARKLNWPRLPVSMPQSHVKSGRPATADLDAHTVAWAHHVTFYDQILYEKARARAMREIAAMNESLPGT
jgi:hypothetical protein